MDNKEKQHIKDVYIRWKRGHRSCWEVVNFLCDLIGIDEVEKLEPKVLPDSPRVGIWTTEPDANGGCFELGYFTKSTPQPEHKSIEEVKKEFEDRFANFNGNIGYINDNDTPSFYSAKTLFDFFLPHLNSRNLLERFMKYLAMKDAIGMRTELYKQLIDEFIESEVGK